MSIETRLNRYYDDLNKNEKEIISFILKNKKDIAHMTITSLSEASLASKSSIMRLTQKLNYSGYSEFKYDLQNQINEYKGESHLSFFNLQNEDINTTQKLFSQMDLTPILEKMHSSERIFCYGTGWGQRDVLSNLTRSLVPFNLHLNLLSSLKEVEMASKYFTEKDFLLVVSLSGDIKEAEPLMKSLVLKDIPILSITELKNNDYASLSTYNLYYQTTPIDYEGEQIFSFAPLYIVTDLLLRKYAEYVMQGRGE